MTTIKKPKVKSNKILYIATGDSRWTKHWTPREISWADLLEKLSTPTVTRETQAEYKKMKKTQRDGIKDVGGFVGGVLKKGRRKSENVANRTVITLDMDYIKTSVDDVWDSITMLYDCELCIYSTHSHTKENPRLRLIIPIDRSVFPDEYQAIARRIADDIGIDMFDDTTYEPSRLMYWPSTPCDVDLVFRHQQGDFLNSDKVLDTYVDWKDITQWPVSSRQDHSVQHEIKKQEDPYEKNGLVGAFCRTYSISDVIDKFLSDIYVPTNTKGRYTYKAGSTIGGLVVYEDKFAYSHHGTDPISGMLCNAFDLVRLHMYGLMDEDAKENTPVNRLPSYLKMIDFAREDENVKTTIIREKRKEVDEDFEFEDKDDEENWEKNLEVNKKGVVEDTIENALVILKNDSRVKEKLMYDEFSNRAFVNGKAPWTSSDTHDWTDTDDSGVRYFLELNYGITGAAKIEDAKNLVFDHNRYHPVREYLDDLKWDGKKRVETLFIDYLGAENSLYVREVTKIHLVAAVARVYEPGIKYDTYPVLIGPQGIGKSTFIRILSNGWFSDSLDTMKGKEAAELIQGQWHIELGELNATRKSEIEEVKAFLSRQYDIYRVAYARNTSRFPRQCVFWGSTNDANFLRDPTGDRRTYPISCFERKPKKDIFLELEDEVDQIWAEAVQMYRKGHPLILKGEAAKMAIEKQKEHKEDVPLKGLIVQYLDELYPSNWEDMTIQERRSFLQGGKSLFDNEDTEDIKLTYQKNKVCVLEVWCELLGKRSGDLRPIDSRNINDILRGLDNWEPTTNPISFGKEYGKQRGFLRKLAATE